MRGMNYVVIQDWMRFDLGLNGTELLVYAIIYGASQDGDTKFSGSRQYLADWCGCTVRSIQTALNNLTERGLLTKSENVHNNIKWCEYVANFTTRENFSPVKREEKEEREEDNEESRKKERIKEIKNKEVTEEEEEEKEEANPASPDLRTHAGACMRSVRAHTRLFSAYTNNADVVGMSAPSYTPKPPLSPLTDEIDQHSYTPDELRQERKALLHVDRPVKRSLYDQCVDEIYTYTDNLLLQDKLTDYLALRLKMSDKKIYGVNQWRGIMNKLGELKGDPVKIVNQSIEHGWATFYELDKPKTTNGPAGTQRTYHRFGESPNMSCKSVGDLTEEERRNYWSGEDF